MAKPFKFKQFTIEQDRCAMQIGTDGVLLGAWVSLKENPYSILDLGTGTGVIALQLAQRSFAETIDAVEIDENAFEQCIENFENSLWADRLYCYHASAQEFVAEIDEKYDLIITNPPFYSEDYITENEPRNLARFSDSFPLEDIIACGYHLLSENGILAVILPKKEEERFVLLASEAGLYPRRVCHVRGNATSEEKRSLMEFSFLETQTIYEYLTIEISRHEYTVDYKKLVSDFYLKM